MRAPITRDGTAAPAESPEAGWHRLAIQVKNPRPDDAQRSGRQESGRIDARKSSCGGCPRIPGKTRRSHDRDPREHRVFRRVRRHPGSDRMGGLRRVRVPRTAECHHCGPRTSRCEDPDGLPSPRRQACDIPRWTMRIGAASASGGASTGSTPGGPDNRRSPARRASMIRMGAS